MSIWIEAFKRHGVTDEEAKELYNIALDYSNATGTDTLRVLIAIEDVIKFFKPQQKIGDWLDIFR